MKNPYLPLPMRIEKITVETGDKSLKTFSLGFVREEDQRRFSFVPGQFAEVGIFGKGEAPFGIASSPMDTTRVEFTVYKVPGGTVTTALHEACVGYVVGMRGPYGNGFPLGAMQGCDILIIGGGFAFTTLRSLVNYMLHSDNRARFGRIQIIYGAREPGLLLYKEELAEWQQRNDLALTLTVDRCTPADGWTGCVGVVPKVLQEARPPAANTYTVVCGPPVMIRFTLPVLQELGFGPERILLSLEMKMKCGIGVCGRCNIGHKYVCKDGPVFSLAELSQLPSEY
ncbi:MAG TPA: heterodisulfide reductase subunit F [Desulfotomaculum sp.]|nr:heterodisulfide reductase subunit F [Desulfotomaculum sp.]